MKGLLIICCLTLSLAGYSQNLSLKEKQAIANLDFSWAEKRIAENYSSPVKIELDQASFAGDMDAILYADSRGATVAANGIAKVCDNKLGKEALQGKKITKVLLKNDKTNSPKVVIDKGVMTLLIGFSTSDKYYSDSELREAIENML
ncbi:hypothetical protein WSM22_04850 [Cytophagales bacterium WSM2-2]|nr:hypothetical protein WSM22_04850 [Cytophagales bacterium WSM2-2]